MRSPEKAGAGGEALSCKVVRPLGLRNMLD